MSTVQQPVNDGLFQQLMEGSDDLLFYERDAEGRFTYISPSARIVLGIAPHSAEGHLPIELGLKVLNEMRTRVIEESNTVQRVFTATARHAQGHTVELEVVENRSTIDSTVRTYGFARDITQHRDIERQLQLSDEILRNVDTMVLVANSDGLIVFGSPSITRILGYSQAEITGFGWWIKSRAHPDEQRRAATRAAEVASGVRHPRSEPWEREIIDSEGQTHWVLWQECRSANHLAIFCGQDITSHRRTERELVEHKEELFKSQQELLAIFECAVEGIFILDQEGCIRDVNPSGARILGRNRYALIGHQLEDFAEDSLAAKSLLAELRDKGFTRGELRFQHGGEQIIYAECTAKGSILPGVDLLVMRDETQRHELEEQLRQAQKMEAIGRLAGGVAHDINNMLTVIQGYSELILRSSSQNESLRRHANSILTAVDRCGLITQQLLAFSRRQVLQPRTLNLNQVVAEMSKLLQKLLGEDAQLCLRLSPALGEVTADSGQVAQILLNLAANARDAIPNGGWITIETRNTTLDHSLAHSAFPIEAGEYVTLSITDNGCGMTPEVQTHIFEPFFTTKELGKGTGLGLSTVYGIVRQNRGAVVVQSLPGEGSTFTVYLPRTDAHSALTHLDGNALQESQSCGS